MVIDFLKHQRRALPVAHHETALGGRIALLWLPLCGLAMEQSSKEVAERGKFRDEKGLESILSVNTRLFAGSRL